MEDIKEEKPPKKSAPQGEPPAKSASSKKTKQLPIVLGVSQSSRAIQRPSEMMAKPELTGDIKKKVFEADDYTCRFCNFKSQKYQDVHFINGREDDLRADNLATSCVFCHQCFSIEKVADMRSGFLVWLPEISQPDLHNIARAVYVARISQGPIADAARQIMESIMTRREVVKTRLGTDDPSILAMVLRDYISSKSYEMRKKKLEGVRLFPLDRRIIKEADLEFNQFPQILAYWRSKNGPFGGLIPKKWIDLYKENLL